MTPSQRLERGFVGVLESPLDDDAPLLGERIEVRGWALAQPGCDAVEARLQGEPMALGLSTGIPRVDVAAAFDLDVRAAACGFSGWLELEGPRVGQTTLEITARRGDEVLHRWARRLSPTPVDEAYRRWRQRLQQALPEPEAWATPLATWLVVAPGDAARARKAAERLRLAVQGSCDVVAAVDASSPADWSTPYVGVLHVDDTLDLRALESLRRGLPDQPPPDFVYGDHDGAIDGGLCGDPVFKPDWSPLLLAHPAIGPRGWLVRRTLLDGPSDLAALAAGTAVPKAIAARCASGWHLRAPLVTLGHASLPPAQPAPGPASHRDALAVVIPTRLADMALLARCLDGLRAEPEGRSADIVVVLNNLRIDMQEAMRFLERWSVRCLRAEGGFNWSHLNNFGARETSAGTLLFLNDDVEPMQAGWLAAMARLQARPGIGAVGAVLRYPDGRIQHAGIYIHGGEGAECRHVFRHCSGQEQRVGRWLSHDRTHTAVTGACLMTSRAAFDAVGGFDEDFPLVCNDVDYCLRLARRGLSSAVAAGAQLYHHEGASRAGLAEHADQALFVSRWGRVLPPCDRFSHPQLQRARDDWMFDPSRLPVDVLLPR